MKKKEIKLVGIHKVFHVMPVMGRRISQMAQDLLLDRDSSLSRIERELVFAIMSIQNHCKFCSKSHFMICKKLMEAVGDKTLDNLHFETGTASIKLHGRRNLIVRFAKYANAIDVSTWDFERIIDHVVPTLPEEDRFEITTLYHIIEIVAFAKMVNTLVGIFDSDKQSDVLKAQDFEAMANHIIEKGYINESF